jgi:UDP-2,4-diacetamido-2,4,6-trideoxy-beta-L-altropyranose hydrolase
MTVGTLLVRVDADPIIGMGHVMRCLALAQDWRVCGGRVVFVSARLPGVIGEQIRDDGMIVESLGVEAGAPGDALRTRELGVRHGAAWAVVDGYHLPEGYGEALRRVGIRTLVVDDRGRSGRHDVDMVADQSPGAREDHYRIRGSDTRFLLGSRYALLRQEFRRLRPDRLRAIEPGRHLLITMGGGDRANVTKSVLDAVSVLSRPDLRITVLVGAVNLHRTSIETAAAMLRLPIVLLGHEQRVADRMARADTAVAAAGHTAWELAYMQIPSLLLVTADNQRSVGEGMAVAGAAVCVNAMRPVRGRRLAGILGRLLDDVPFRGDLSASGGRLVDGFGAHRITAALRGLPLTLRYAEASDRRRVWEWSNDPSVRQAAFSEPPIPWAAHERWFAEVTSSDRWIFLIGEDATGTPVGQVRFEIEGDDATVSVSLAPQRWGRGLGTALIAAGTEQLFALTRACRVRALIRDDNPRSRRAFEKAGYSYFADTARAGRSAWELVRHRRSDN